MARVPDVVYGSHVYEISDFGSPPFSTSLQFKLASNGSPTASQVTTLISGLVTEWDDHLGPLINNTVEGGSLQTYFESGGVVSEASTAIADGGNASSPDQPGCSARCLKRHARLAGQRFGSFYLPVTPTSYYDNTGAIIAAGTTAIQGGLDDYQSGVEGIDGGIWVICQVPTTATTIGDTHTVTSMEAPTTISYMNRRYR